MTHKPYQNILKYNATLSLTTMKQLFQTNSSLKKLNITLFFSTVPLKWKFNAILQTVFRKMKQNFFLQTVLTKPKRNFVPQAMLINFKPKFVP